MPTKPIVIATRGSALALVQANAVLRQCQQALPDQQFELQIFKTTGDKLQTASLASAELPKGLFTKELEVALLGGHADLAVHSLKDLPTELPDGLTLGAVGKREDVRDVLVYRGQVGQGARGFLKLASLKDLPHGATVATSSTRREAQLREARPDIAVVPIRGNVGTRLRKLLENPALDATMLAAAGLHRLGFKISDEGSLSGGPEDKEPVPSGTLRLSYLPISEMIPCVGQAAIGIEVRKNDLAIQAVCEALNHRTTQWCVLAERAFLNAMGGGCQAAVAAYAEIRDGQLVVRAVSYLKGEPRRAELSGNLEDAEAVGRNLAARL